MRSFSHPGRVTVIFLLLLVLAAAVTGCSQPGAQPTQAPSPSSAPGVAVVPPAWKLVWNGHYAQNIQPIFNERCVSCHGPTRADKQLRLDSYDALMKGSQDGPVVVPGSLTASPLLSTIDGTATGSSRMPPTGPRVPDTEVQNVRLWIEAGAPSDGAASPAAAAASPAAGATQPAATKPAGASPAAGTTQPAAPAKAPGDPAAGQQAIGKYGCGGCHTIPGIQGANGTVGPNLAGVSKLPVIAGTSTQMTPENLIKWIMNPPSIKPGTAMPVLGVNQTDAQNIVAYLYTLQ